MGGPTNTYQSALTHFKPSCLPVCTPEPPKVTLSDESKGDQAAREVLVWVHSTLMLAPPSPASGDLGLLSEGPRWPCCEGLPRTF